ncbi:hypothetical protein [Siculibacillus lacustris]|nr:hypothetical protein [Siculibacillus lacustris]
MAKGQKKSNREVRKPKSDKPKVVESEPLFGKAQMAGGNPPKKKPRA